MKKIFLLLLISINLTSQLKAENETKETLNFLSKLIAGSVSCIVIKYLNVNNVRKFYTSLDKNFFAKPPNESYEIHQSKSLFVCQTTRVICAMLAGLFTYDILRTR